MGVGAAVVMMAVNRVSELAGYPKGRGHSRFYRLLCREVQEMWLVPGSPGSNLAMKLKKEKRKIDKKPVNNKAIIKPTTTIRQHTITKTNKELPNHIS